MSFEDWGYAQTDPSEQLAKVHYFSIHRPHEVTGQPVEFTITVKEFHSPKDPTMPFFAQADKQTNQKIAPYTATGWGKTMFQALAQCVRELNRFPYQG